VQTDPSIKRFADGSLFPRRNHDIAGGRRLDGHPWRALRPKVRPAAYLEPQSEILAEILLIACWIALHGRQVNRYAHKAASDERLGIDTRQSNWRNAAAT